MDETCLWQHRLHGEKKKNFEEGACWMKNLAVQAISDILKRNFGEELRSNDMIHIVSLLEMKLDKHLDDYGEYKEI